MTPLKVPEPYLDVRLTKRMCEASQRAIAWVIKHSPEAEADHELLVQSLGAHSVAIKDEEERLVREGR